MTSLQRLSIAFFDTVTDATLAPLWGDTAGGPDEAFDYIAPAETEKDVLNKERLSMGLVPRGVVEVTPSRITRLDLSHLPRQGGH